MNSEQFEALKKKTLEYRKNYGEEWEVRKSMKKDILLSIARGDEEALTKILDETKPFSDYDEQTFDMVEFTEYNQETIQSSFDCICDRQAGPTEEENIIHLKILFRNEDSKSFYVKVNKYNLFISTGISKKLEDTYLIQENEENRAKLGKIGIKFIGGIRTHYTNDMPNPICMIYFK